MSLTYTSLFEREECKSSYIEECVEYAMDAIDFFFFIFIYFYIVYSTSLSLSLFLSFKSPRVHLIQMPNQGRLSYICLCLTDQCLSVFLIVQISCQVK